MTVEGKLDKLADSIPSTRFTERNRSGYEDYQFPDYEREEFDKGGMASGIP
jgi:hypothetical protein